MDNQEPGYTQSGEQHVDDGDDDEYCNDDDNQSDDDEDDDRKSNKHHSLHPSGTLKPRTTGQVALDQFVPKDLLHKSGLKELLGPHIVNQIRAEVEKAWQIESDKIAGNNGQSPTEILGILHQWYRAIQQTYTRAVTLGLVPVVESKISSMKVYSDTNTSSNQKETQKHQDHCGD